MLYKITEDLLKKCVSELNKEENKKNIDVYIVEPFIEAITTKIQPYTITLFIMYILILVLLIIVLITIISNKN